MKWLVIKEASKYSTPITADLVDEIRQNAMLSVVVNLPHFRFESKLTTWLMPIARTRTIDALRVHTRNIRENTPLNTLIEGEESEEVTYEIEMPGILEEVCITGEELRAVLAEIFVYVNSHAKPERNRKIAEMVLLAGHTLEEAAREVGVSSAVASYVIRTLRQHLQEKFRTPPPSA
jgi:RNA polymerase sigma factor (sigma-70 family)